MKISTSKISGARLLTQEDIKYINDNGDYCIDVNSNAAKMRSLEASFPESKGLAERYMEDILPGETLLPCDLFKEEVKEIYPGHPYVSRGHIAHAALRKGLRVVARERDGQVLIFVDAICCDFFGTERCVSHRAIRHNFLIEHEEHLRRASGKRYPLNSPSKVDMENAILYRDGYANKSDKLAAPTEEDVSDAVFFLQSIKFKKGGIFIHIDDILEFLMSLSNYQHPIEKKQLCRGVTIKALENLKFEIVPEKRPEKDEVVGAWVFVHPLVASKVATCLNLQDRHLKGH